MARIATPEEEEYLLSKIRHEEIKDKLGSLVSALNNDNDKAIIDAIKLQGDKIGQFATAIDNKKIVSCIEKMRDDIIQSNEKVIKALENRLLPDTFTLIKSRMGLTESVKVEYKPANKIKSDG